MPLDFTHQHSSADVMDAANPHTPISPGSPPTLAEVLAAGNAPNIDPAIQAAAGASANGAYLSIQADPGTGAGGSAGVGGADGDATHAGGEAFLYGGNGAGDGNGQANPASVDAFGGSADGSGGRLELAGGRAKIGSGKAGGDVLLEPGAGDGAGRNGLVFLNLPTSDPGVAGALWADTLVVKVSAG